MKQESRVQSTEGQVRSSAPPLLKSKSHDVHLVDAILSPPQVGQKSVDQSSEMLTILQQLTDFQQLSTLPKSEIDHFDGSDDLAFPTFINNFETLVCRTSDPARKLEILLKYTKVEAKNLIKDCILIDSSEDAYNRAIKLLKTTYGHPATIASAYEIKATNWPRLKSGNKDALRKFSICYQSLYSQSGKPTPHWCGWVRVLENIGWEAAYCPPATMDKGSRQV